MNEYTPIIGLEIHVELKTKSKMFCSCANDPEAEIPNTHICPICLAHPGTLPLPNRAAIIDTIKIARALGCQINPLSKFDRKHYFYPDLPKGYQISQYDQPIGEKGSITLQLLTGKNHRPEAKIGITRVHLEEDTAKLYHEASGTTAVDFNRAGVPLVEIVTDPDIESALEAKTYCQELQQIFRYLGVSDAHLEKGQMRCEANVSVQKTGSFIREGALIQPVAGAILNAKVEVKNLNSFRAIEKAILHEIERQVKLTEALQTWEPETRGWDEQAGVTVYQRSKESAADYRYFPEPDIPPFRPLALADAITLPELPQAKRNRFHAEYGFSLADSYLLTADLGWAEYAEETMSELLEWLRDLPESESAVDPLKDQSKQQIARLAGGWITSKLMGLMAERKMDIQTLKLKPENFAELIALIFTGRVNSTNAQKILVEMLESGVDLDPTHVLEERGYGQISDETKLSGIIDQIINSYPDQVAAFKAGKEPIIKFLLGMIMKTTEGSADPTVAERILRGKLKS